MEGVLGRGPIGVELFFALSGFLITSLLLHERREGGIDLRAFWVRRSLRIFPLYYLVLSGFVLHALLVRPDGPVRDHFLQTVPFYATYTSNWFSYKAVDHGIVFAFAWSLAAEEQFYLLWPPILRAFRTRLVPVIAMSALVLLDQSAERGWLGSILEEGLVLRMMRSIATPIGLGALLALANDHPKTAKVLRAFVGQRWSSAVCLAGVVVALVRPWPLFETHVALALLVGSCALRRDHFLAPLLENRLVRHIGMVSYGIYLLNCSVVGVVRRLLGAEANAVLVFAITISASVIVATVAYQKVERPFLALRDRFRAPDRSRPKSEIRLDLAT
jgi:peptidoglycan/LPS O-acetylase OafA/YrhL